MRPDVMLGHFPLPTVRAVIPVGSGLLHVTYKVVTVGGDFVVQRLHDAIPDSAVEDMRLVTTYLVSRGLQVAVRRAGRSEARGKPRPLLIVAFASPFVGRVVELVEELLVLLLAAFR